MLSFLSLPSMKIETRDLIFFSLPQFSNQSTIVAATKLKMILANKQKSDPHVLHNLNKNNVRQ